MLLSAMGLAAAGVPPVVVISEILASNAGGLRDEDGDSSDWIELHNPGAESCSLNGWWLTDTEGDLKRWRIPEVTLASDARLVIFASGKDRRLPDATLHTGFRLSAAGGYVALVHPDGRTVVSEIRYDPQRANVSVGRARERFAPWISRGTEGRLTVPSDDSLGLRWTAVEEAPGNAAWRPVVLPAGFDAGISGPDLAAYWDFDTVAAEGAIADRSPRGHHGRLRSASLTTPGQGRSGLGDDRAVRLTGSGWMEVPGAGAGMLDGAVAANAITLSLWIRGDDSQPSNDSIFWAGSEPGGGGIRSLNAHLPWSDQVIYWDTAGCCDSGVHRISVSEPDASQWRGGWNHYAFVKRGGRKEIWQNGRLLLSGAGSADLTPIRSLYLGSAGPGQGGYHGWMDEVAIWESALDPGLIAALAAGASPLELRRLAPWIVTDVEEDVRGRNASAYLRVPFEVSEAELPEKLSLILRYDDGFIAYLNGTEILRRLAPEIPAFDSAATGTRPDGEVTEPVEWEIPAEVGRLHTGTNMLAIHWLNRSREDEDFLMDIDLAGTRELGLRHFPEPTPGRPNGPGVDGLVEAPEVTPGRGFQENPVTITLRTATPGASLAYTTNGSVPGPENGVVVPGPEATIRLARTTVLRATAFRSGWLAGPVVTHTYVFPGDVPAQRRPSGVAAQWPDGSPTDFAVDSRVVNSALPGYGFREALLQIPTVSLVLPQEDLFGPSGIYANPEARGDAWERRASLEWFQWDGGRAFQQDAGLSVRGGISRNKGFTPKHGFRVNFRGIYGAGSLDQALFPDNPALGFDRLLLRGGSTDTWPCVEWSQLVDGVQRWYRREASNLRDQWVRDAQIAMGQPSAHGRYVHLYLNGLYWGLYNVCERPDHDFLALHLGGRPEEYDSVADFAELHAGTLEAWNRMISLSGADLSVNANYQRLLGNRADGTRDPALEVLLDVDNLIDYMVLHIFIGADDWPNHNWWAGRRRGPESTGFKFFAWDQEISISSLVRQHSSWGPIYAEANAPNTPAYVYSRCRRNPEFRQRFADRVYRHLFGSGALSVTNNIVRWASRVAEVDQAIVAESARWGDHQRPGQPYRREVEWLANDRWMRNTYFPSNHWVAVKRFRDAALYPRVDPPEWSAPGGVVTPGFEVTLRNPNPAGTVWYTADGTDPRQPGGAVSGAAVSGEAPPPISGRTTLRARVRDGTVWSALAEVTFVTASEYASLIATEIHYHPAPDDFSDGDDAEFLELFNGGDTVLDLSGLAFTAGLEFEFPAGSRLDPGAYGVLVRDAAGFARRFPGVIPLGVYRGALSNGGETLALAHSAGFSVFSFAFGDAPPWAPGADGRGLSLQRSDLARPPGVPGAWVAAPPSPGAPLNPALSDSDADGIPDDWERLYGMDPLRNDAADDADADGRSALEEFLAGTNPQDPLSRLRLEGIAGDPDAPAGAIRFGVVAGRSYRVERRESLATGTWLPYARVKPLAADDWVRLALPPDAPHGYYRVVTPDPDP